jgi:glucoside 3-dehydrogenase (cytochrome c) hitch-hiker subunit
MTEGANHNGHGGPESLSRRQMIEATAAALAAPLLKVEAVTAPSAGGLSSRFLTPAEYALLDELTERIIPADEHSPGARAAGVAAYIDARLGESLEPEWQALWRSGLQAVDGLSRELNGKPLLDATPDERVAVLTQMAAGESDPKTPLEHFFKELKRWTVRGYYTSKIGIHVDQEYKGNVYQRGEFAGLDPT